MKFDAIIIGSGQEGTLWPLKWQVFPQTFVHASFIGAVIDLKKKEEELTKTSNDNQ